MFNKAFKYGLPLALLLVVAITTLAGKSKKQLEIEQKKLQKELLETQKILNNTQKAKKASLGQLRALNHQIRERKKYIRSLQEEVDYYNKQIIQSSDIIRGMENDLTNLKEEYAKMIYQASKKNSSLEKLAFIFSAKSINQLQLRLKYISMYNASRMKQVKIISEVKDMLMGEQAEIVHQKDAKNQLLTNMVDEEIKLETSKIEQSTMVKSLALEEKQLSRKLKEQRKRQKEIDNLIAKIIEENAKGGFGTLPPAELAKLSKDFKNNKGRLPWPTDKGFVSHGFGQQPHPVFGSKSMMDYKGIGVQTNPAQKVKAIFDGQVKMVANIPGHGQLVMIGHGDYISVYNKLKTIYVKKGDIVKASDEIGTVLTTAEGETELDFQLWQGKTPINPQSWLVKK